MQCAAVSKYVKTAPLRSNVGNACWGKPGAMRNQKYINTFKSVTLKSPSSLLASAEAENDLPDQGSACFTAALLKVDALLVRSAC